MRQIVVTSTGAWDAWRAEVRAGKRTAIAPMDTLFHAAWCDANGLDCLDAYRACGVETEIRLAAMWFEESEALLCTIPAEQSEAA